MESTKRYIRVGVFPIEAILPFVFTRDIRKKLRKSGCHYNSEEWINASRRIYNITINGTLHRIKVRMGSHRYQLFAEQGVVCRRCGLEGKFFALEKDKGTEGLRFHFNLYGFDKDRKEVMLTKDHIHPRSKGGKSRPENYQVLCQKCNQAKADKTAW